MVRRQLGACDMAAELPPAASEMAAAGPFGESEQGQRGKGGRRAVWITPPALCAEVSEPSPPFEVRVLRRRRRRPAQAA